MVGIFDTACELLPPWTKELYSTVLVYCCPSTFSLTSPPLPPSQTKFTVQFSTYIQTVCGFGGGGGINCVVDHILQEFYTLFLTRFRTYKIASPPHTKMTCKDDLKGLVSLKFLRPCPHPTLYTLPRQFYRKSPVFFHFPISPTVYNHSIYKYNLIDVYKYNHMLL
jgi:hypothetical protein